MRKIPFYHGSNTALRPGESLLPAEKHGNHVWEGVGRPDVVYVSGNEDDAWRWASEGRSRAKSAGKEVEAQRVYEVDPGELSPDPNLDGPQFTTPRAKIVRELPAPIGAQLTTTPNAFGQQFERLESGTHRAVQDIRSRKMQYKEADARKARYESQHPQLFAPEGERVDVINQRGYKQLRDTEIALKAQREREYEQQDERHYAQYRGEAMELRRDREKLMEYNLSRLQFSGNS